MNSVLYILREERDRLRTYIELIDQTPGREPKEVWDKRRAQAIDEIGLMEELLRAAAAWSAGHPGHSG